VSLTPAQRSARDKAAPRTRWHPHDPTANIRRALPAVGAGAVAGGGAWAGHPAAGLAVAAAIVAGQLAVLGAPVVAASLIALFRKDTKDAVKRIGALTDLIDKLR
jgi:hypothetical protein